MVSHVQVAVARITDRLTGLLAQAIREVGGDKGTLQVTEADLDLRIVAHQGFDGPFLAHFDRVKPFDGSVCGRAAGIGSPVIVADLQADKAFAPHLEVATREGIRSVISYPVLNDRHHLLGVLAVHCLRTREEWPAERLRPVGIEIAALLDELQGLPSEGRSHREELQVPPQDTSR